MKKIITRIIGGLGALVIGLTPLVAHATIRDAEIEYVLRHMSAPLFRSAGLKPENVNMFLINQPSINAFVAGGPNIFIHSGLIEASESPEMFLGVIAHEIGHIDGAHLARMSQQTDTVVLGSIFSTIIGLAAAIGGAGEVGAAVGTGGNEIFQRNFLSHIRINEQAADQAALRYLKENDISAEGMLTLFEILRRQERQRIGIAIPEYVRSHPLTESRIARVENYISENPDQPKLSQVVYVAYGRARAKLYAFLNEPEDTLRRYPKHDASDVTQYARAIAMFRKTNFSEARRLMKGLIEKYPQDPFYYDTYGQILYESGNIDEAITAYEKSLELLPNTPLLQSELAKSLIHRDAPGDIKRATELLEASTQRDNSYSTAWRYLATAYGKQRKLGLSHLALAEEAALSGDHRAIMRETERALATLDKNSAGFFRAQDLKKYAVQLKEKDS